MPTGEMVSYKTLDLGLMVQIHCWQLFWGKNEL